ncbi:cell division protein ZapA [Ferrimonas lipolytica]|uniref:Cell division protein ZapA n=1 Tax=Ferrimonas lipolytica TaxID=2724191 RepID=A0A6H1UGB2_9GAMM|nr:cell division protein ZapA [Ferrimonas lipolytica]QIZ77669.1 cell division protein ZapA [Ferrimonas lipolytica]
MSTNTTDISVLGRNYTVTCPPEQREHLQQIAAELHLRFDQLKQRTGTTSMEHLAVMVALNLLHEQDQSQLEHAQRQMQMQKRLKALEASIEQRLGERITNPKKPVEPSQ